MQSKRKVDIQKATQYEPGPRKQFPGESAKRESLRKKLSLLSDLYVYPSSANFLLCKVSNVNLEDLNIKLIKDGVFIRLFPSKSLENCFRVSIGTKEENEYFYKVLVN